MLYSNIQRRYNLNQVNHDQGQAILTVQDGQQAILTVQEWTGVNDAGNFRSIVLQTIDRPIKRQTLIRTKFGFICPRCMTSEHVRDDRSWLPSSLQDRPTRTYHCDRCDIQQQEETR